MERSAARAVRLEAGRLPDEAATSGGHSGRVKLGVHMPRPRARARPTAATVDVVRVWTLGDRRRESRVRGWYPRSIVKLGEALTMRADLQKRIAQLTGRIQASAVVQEGDRPPEDPARLLDELRQMSADLEWLITAINLTNAASSLTDGQTVTAALAKRDLLAVRQGVLRSAAEAVTQAQARYSRSEIRLARQLDVAAVRKEIDDLARQRRVVDTAIQEHNWTTDLIEDASR
ncbi:MAG: hypothetical protein AVDCRST_MAG53-3362 [uncultured Solirubrobacteraceae bacterium]|uniref:DIP1984 family protein n=1 Tax=uncultured Solirubrobacteraceae bacterium TaxID=1162706 RepID=A0A6J4TF48_9ACTN|nr:MAG: hypothetical protein AVDCRST_MAG53-3362 [uncultured Solirubrobacteraceae bacterium]